MILSCDQIRSCDQIALQRFEIMGLVLMENAGSAAARYILSLLPKPTAANVSIITGTGNNAGDGFVVARHLYNAGVGVNILICGSRNRVKGDALANLRIIEHMELPIKYINSQSPSDIARTVNAHANRADIIVDALLGTGTAGAPREPIRTAIETINELKPTIVSLDIPSGLDCDSGEPLELAVHAQHTVTFAALKKGFQKPTAHKYTGSVTVASIGIDTALLQ